MLDRKFIIDQPDQVRRNCAERGARVDLDRFLELDRQCRARLQAVEEFNRQANEVSQSIGKAPDAAGREALKQEGRRLRLCKETAQQEHDQLLAELVQIQRAIPNLSHPAAPRGGDEQSNVELRRGRHAPRSFDTAPRDHVQLGSELGLLDFEAGAKTTGHGFYFLTGDAVLLELALQRYALQLLSDEGFTPTTTPDLARNEILEGIGFIPRGPETQIYSVENTDLSLVATAEITLGGMLAGEVLAANDLPVKLCGISHCFRTEAGAHGKATRGLYRVHQFTKVEMFAFTLPEQSETMLEHFCDLECRLFDSLEIPYRVVDTATGDLGGPAYRKYDLEAWMPGRGEGGAWGEVTSTSNCTDYQARRLNVRYKQPGEKGTHFVHTLNGTAVAISRALIALLENHQQPDGSVVIPPPLRAIVGKDRLVPA
jgi:seryl-tRNA synthetase